MNNKQEVSFLYEIIKYDILKIEDNKGMIEWIKNMV